MYGYILLIKPVSLLLDSTNLQSLSDFELCSLFEQVQEVKGNNKSTNSALLNLLTYLDITYGKSLEKLNLGIISTESVDKNLMWGWEVEAILQSDELVEQDKLFIQTVYECGSRITEVYQLIGEDVDTVGELLHFRTNRLGKMKNRFSTRNIPFYNLSDELVNGLLSHANKLKHALFDFDNTQKKQHDFRKFCLRINTIIKKITGRNVSLKHLRHSTARAKFLDHENETSLRSYYQDAGNMGHSNLLTSQKNYIQSTYEESVLIEVNDDDTAALLDITPANLRQRRCRFRNENPDNKMNNKMLNAFLSVEYIKKSA
jgi:site-specific recombinase XerD